MSPLERIEWLRRVRDAGATLSALSVAVECAYRDGGDGAWGSLGGSAIGERAARVGRLWLVEKGFLRRIHRAWLVTSPTGTTVPDSGTTVPKRNDDAENRNDDAAPAGAGTTVPDSGTTVPPAKPHKTTKTAPPFRRNGTTVPEKRHHRATEQGLTGKNERGAPARPLVSGNGEPAKAPPKKPYDVLRDELRRFGLPTSPAAVAEWGKLLQGPVIAARTVEQCLEAVRWVLTQADKREVTIRYARDAVELGREWRKSKKSA